MNYFESINLFYDEFFRILPEIINNQDLSSFLEENPGKIRTMQETYSFDSLKGIKFRLVRDFYLKNDEYQQLMFLMFKKFDFDYQAALEDLFLTKENVKEISDLNHIAGLHSHTHPTKLELLRLQLKKNEYVENKKILEEITHKEITSVSHPLGSL